MEPLGDATISAGGAEGLPSAMLRGVAPPGIEALAAASQPGDLTITMTCWVPYGDVVIVGWDSERAERVMIAPNPDTPHDGQSVLRLTGPLKYAHPIGEWVRVR